MMSQTCDKNNSLPRASRSVSEVYTWSTISTDLGCILRILQVYPLYYTLTIQCTRRVVHLSRGVHFCSLWVTADRVKAEQIETWHSRAVTKDEKFMSLHHFQLWVVDQKSIIQIFERWCINRIMKQKVQKVLIFSSSLTGILKHIKSFKSKSEAKASRCFDSAHQRVFPPVKRSRSTDSPDILAQKLWSPPLKGNLLQSSGSEMCR